MTARRIFRAELALWFGSITMALFLLFGKGWLRDLSGALWFLFVFGWLFGAMLWLSFSVVRHADCRRWPATRCSPC